LTNDIYGIYSFGWIRLPCIIRYHGYGHYIKLILLIGRMGVSGTVGWKIESASLGFLCILVRLWLDTCALVQYLVIRPVSLIFADYAQIRILDFSALKELLTT
jgi:hypothetical protein